MASIPSSTSHAEGSILSHGVYHQVFGDPTNQDLLADLGHFRTLGDFGKGIQDAILVPRSHISGIFGQSVASGPSIASGSSTVTQPANGAMPGGEGGGVLVACNRDERAAPLSDARRRSHRVHEHFQVRANGCVKTVNKETVTCLQATRQRNRQKTLVRVTKIITVKKRIVFEPTRIDGFTRTVKEDITEGIEVFNGLAETNVQ